MVWVIILIVYVVGVLLNLILTARNNNGVDMIDITHSLLWPIVLLCFIIYLILWWMGIFIIY